LLWEMLLLTRFVRSNLCRYSLLWWKNDLRVYGSNNIIWRSQSFLKMHISLKKQLKTVSKTA